MSKMQDVLQAMDRNVAYLPGIVTETSKMQGVVELLRSDTHDMSERVSHLQVNLTGITGNMDQMTQTFRGLEGTVQNMGVDVNKMSGPSRMFNNMMPFHP
jgi:methyl-accepting chemotaxis protein